MSNNSTENILKLLAKHDRDELDKKESGEDSSSIKDRAEHASEFSGVLRAKGRSPVDDASGRRPKAQKTGDVHDPGNGSADTAASSIPPAHSGRRISARPTVDDSKSPPVTTASGSAGSSFVESDSRPSPLSDGGQPPPTPTSVPQQVPMVFPASEGWYYNITQLRLPALRKTAEALGIDSDGTVDDIRARLLQLQGEAVVKFVDRDSPIKIVSLGAGFTSPAAPSSQA